MTPKEVFAIYVDPRGYSVERGIDIYSRYWEVEMELADEVGIAYCNLEICDIYSRTCATCGFVNNTNSYGGIPGVCQNDRCQVIRKFWGINGEIYKFAHLTGDKLRAQWLRPRIGKLFGEGKLSSIPKELRFEFLFAAMIERVMHEDRKNDAGLA